jgi:hypothetical protein
MVSFFKLIYQLNVAQLVKISVAVISAVTFEVRCCAQLYWFFQDAGQQTQQGIVCLDHDQERLRSLVVS